MHLSVLGERCCNPEQVARLAARWTNVSLPRRRSSARWLFSSGGAICTVEDECTHHPDSQSEGYIEASTVECDFTMGNSISGQAPLSVRRP
jgi:nitrite reductase/ring-hydroxylating ferredoxin subunit